MIIVPSFPSLLVYKMLVGRSQIPIKIHKMINMYLLILFVCLDVKTNTVKVLNTYH